MTQLWKFKEKYTERKLLHPDVKGLHFECLGKGKNFVSGNIIVPYEIGVLLLESFDLLYNEYEGEF